LHQIKAGFFGRPVNNRRGIGVVLAVVTIRKDWENIAKKLTWKVKRASWTHGESSKGGRGFCRNRQKFGRRQIWLIR
jgi:hypothetical protein